MTRRSGKLELKNSVGEQPCAKNEIMTNGYNVLYGDHDHDDDCDHAAAAYDDHDYDNQSKLNAFWETWLR